MSLLDLNPDQLNQLKILINEKLRKLISDFNGFIENSSGIQLDYSNVKLRILEGNALEFPCSYTVHFESIKRFIEEYFPKDKYREFFEELRKYNFFDLESSLLNPHLTYFGSLFKGYVEKNFETTKSELQDMKKQLPFIFDEELFEEFWRALLPWISKRPIKVKLYYMIYGVNIEGVNCVIDSKRKLNLIIPSIKEKEELVSKLDIRYFYFEGQFKTINRAQIIARTCAWIEQEIELERKQVEDTFTSLNIIHPNHLAEALHLLGATDTYVGLFTLNNKFSPQKITIQPSDGQSKSLVIANPIPQYPEWMQLSFFPAKDKLILDQETRDFLSFYPNYRFTLPADSIIRLSVLRLTRAISSRLIMDVILEVVIGIESLLVEGKGDLSLQFRMNTSWLIGQNYDDRILLESFCKNLYNLRSKIVHGGGKTKDIEKVTAKFGGNYDTVQLARKLYRLVLLRSVTGDGKKIEFIGRKELLNKIKNARLGGDLNLKEYKLFTRNYDSFIVELREKSDN